VGGDLFSHDDWMQECLINSEGLLDVATLRAIWAEMRDLPRGDTGRGYQGARTATMNSAKSMAKESDSLQLSAVASLPGSQVKTDHGKG
jgi:hypothetical protein